MEDQNDVIYQGLLEVLKAIWIFAVAISADVTLSSDSMLHLAS